MKRIVRPAFLVTLLSTGWLGLTAQTGEHKKLIAEANHSTIQFSVPISGGLTRITGKFNEFTIDIDLADNDLTKAKISAVIKVSSINTGIPARDEDLKAKDFFDLGRFPDITFTTDKIIKTDGGYLAKGQFQMHGITRQVDLPFQITGQKGEDVMGFTSRYSIRRSDYNLATEFKHTTDDNFIGNDIGIEIDFWTRRPKVKK